MSDPRPLDESTWRSIRAAFEAEAAFGIQDLPLGDLLEVAAESSPEAASTEKTEASPLQPAGRDSTAQSVQDPLMKTASSQGKSLDEIAAAVASCEACGLCESRTKTVPGQGAAKARLMFVGEAPGYHEDQEGLAFVGPAGQLLTKMISAMGLSREEVFIANILKCRPPENRDPRPEEAQACFHFLLDQIDAVGPEVICALGGHAANNLLNRDDPMYRLRGKIFDFEGRRLVPTYHPSYLLRSPQAKGKAWADLQVVMKLLGLGGK